MRPLRPLVPGLAAGAALLLATAAPAAAQALAPTPMTLGDAVNLALERNLDLSIERLNPMIARQQQRETRGQFDPILSTGVSYTRTERFLNNILERAAPGGIVQENVFTAEYPGLTGRLVTGTQYTFSLITPVTTSNNPLRLYDQAYQPVLSMGASQPLLRDFGVEINTVRIKQAQKLEGVGVAGVEAKMLAVIREVETRYWNLYQAQQSVVLTEGTLGLAADLVERLVRLRAAGLATDTDVSQARAAVEGRRADVARARADLAVAQGQLRLVMDPKVGAADPIVVGGRPPDDGPPSDLWGKVAKALATRPEIRQQQLLIEKVALDERLAHNNTQWRLDALGNLGWNGLAGKGVNSLFGDSSLPSRLQGQDTYVDSFRGFGSPDGNVNYAVGLRLQLPIGNNEAQGKLAQVRLSRRQEELRLAMVKSQIAADVEAAFQDMTAQWARLTAAREGVVRGREQLDAQQRELAAGRSTARKVLEAQEDFARAQDAETRAWVDYAAARARLDAAQAQSFDTYNLVVQR